MKGFQFAGISAGIKKTGAKDLGLIYCESPAASAALFTKNQVVAAPVILGRERIASGVTQAILVNSGNANCFTGQQGMDDAECCASLVASALKIEENRVLVASTGVIGQPLPMDRFESGVPAVVKSLSGKGQDEFAQAILTTDLCTKVITKEIELNGEAVSIIGIAKGSGMIRPDMATMLAFICTDADISAKYLKQALIKANKGSFSRISVDGDTSTNDTVFALASGKSKVTINKPESIALFQQAMDTVCLELSKKIVKDGEGASKLIQITVKGAQTQSDAYRVAETIAHSNLVKTAIYGEDPNWGRITAAAGRSGAWIDQDKMDLYFEDIQLVRSGQWLGVEKEKRAAQVMKNNEITITLDLNIGCASDYFYFCDFSENYVKINADYRS